jgi:hypothetical protein
VNGSSRKHVANSIRDIEPEVCIASRNFQDNFNVIIKSLYYESQLMGQIIKDRLANSVFAFTETNGIKCIKYVGVVTKPVSNSTPSKESIFFHAAQVYVALN